MQKIFYDGKIVSNNNDFAQALFVNEGSVVFVGENDEVLNLKTKDTELVNLQECFVSPTLFSFDENIFGKIDKKIKNAKYFNNSQNFNEIDENYENFPNFEIYKNEYFEIEKEILSRGITTVVELGLDDRAFAFWKKMSNEKLLKIDIVGYVDILQNKKVMDDNCVTYRKSRNGFRLGGYSIIIDGELKNCKAWLKKPYKGSRQFNGFGEIQKEQLFYLIKTALEEKKQLIFSANGDMSIELILEGFQDIEIKEKITNYFKPLIINSGFIPKKHYHLIKKYDIGLLVKIYDKNTSKMIKKELGLFRKKHYYNFNSLLENEIKFIVVGEDKKEIFKFYDDLKKCKFISKMSKFNKTLPNFTDLIKNFIYYYPACFCFEQEAKYSLEVGKKANFLVLGKDVDISKIDELAISKVYIGGELVGDFVE